MKDTYMKQVKKELAFAGEKKSDIISDLNETFASGMEHGESEQDILQRLGSPEEFARDVYEQLGIDVAEKKKFRFKIQAIVSALVFLILSVSVVALERASVSKGVIGQADALTNIQIEGPSLNLQTLLMAACIVALIIFAISIVRYIKSNK